MANRWINTKFWDKKYIRSLTPGGKLLYLYLFTGPLATLCGAYEITEARIAWDTGLAEMEIDSWLQKFAADEKVGFKDDWLVVFNTIEHQQHNTPTIRAAIIKQVSCCPDWVKHSLSIRYEWLSHLNLNSNLNLNSKNGVPPPAADAAVTRDPVWGDGLELLMTTAKMTEAQARPFLGRLAKKYDKQTVLDAIDVTASEKPADPRSFLIGVLRERSGDNMRAKLYVGKDRGGEMAFAECDAVRRPALALDVAQVEIWEGVKEYLRAHLAADVFGTWFEPLIFDGVGDDGESLNLRGGEVTVDWVERYYTNLLTEALVASGLDGWRVAWEREDAGPS